MSADPGHNYRFGGPAKKGWPTFDKKGKLMKEQRIYVCGPMRGKPRNNFPAFDHAAERLRANGWEVVNPADLDREVGVDGSVDFPLGSDATAFLRRDIRELTDCTGIALLPGWEQSAGARVEVTVGVAIGLTFYTFNPATGKATRIHRDRVALNLGD